jgi:subtilisin family serine protease
LPFFARVAIGELGMLPAMSRGFIRDLALSMTPVMTLTRILLVLGLGCSRAPSRPEVRQVSAAPEEFAPGQLLVELRPGIGLESTRLLPSRPSVAAAPSLEATGEANLHRLGGLLLRLERPIIPDATDASNATAAVSRADHDSGPIYLFRLVENPDATVAALGRVLADPRVRRAEVDHVRRIAAPPNDPLFDEQWNLRAVHAPEAWELTTGSPDVVVAVLDTGIISGHPDLNGRLVPGYPESADDGDNRRDADPTDTGGIESSRLHGTHVAGIIGAATNNRLGIAGLDGRCSVMPVRVLGVRGGDGLDSDIAEAVRWASGLPVGKLPPAERPADVLNLSFGGPTVSFTLQRAIDQALSRGVLVVVAAGNGGADARTYSPGGLDSVISVGASSKSGQRADYSNHGPRVDLLAPGGDGSISDNGDGTSLPEGILSTYRDEGHFDNPAGPGFSYYPLTGTSQAAPHVAAAASLARALWPALRQPQLSALLNLSADGRLRCDRDPLSGCGAGLLDVEALLRRVQVEVRCGCAAGLLCLDGDTCVEAPSLHAPHFQDNTLRSRFCAVDARFSAVLSSSSASSPWPWLLGLPIVGFASLRRRARRAKEGPRHE